jgi:hypothetical protein
VYRGSKQDRHPDFFPEEPRRKVLSPEQEALREESCRLTRILNREGISVKGLTLEERRTRVADIKAKRAEPEEDLFGA